MRCQALPSIGWLAPIAIATAIASGSPSSSPLNDPPPGFDALFNGRDLDGWRGFTGGVPSRAKMSDTQRATARAEADERMRTHWRVEEGLLVFDGRGESLVTDEDFGDLELFVDWMIQPGGDSGIYLRGTPQVQIWDNAIGSGGLYNNQENPSEPLIVADNPPGEWNTFRIVMIGDRVSGWLNDFHVVEAVPLENSWSRGTPIASRGPIELQAHGSELRFRNIFIRRITDPQAERELLFDHRLGWWRQARFGMFIHWGPVSLRGTEIGWSRGAQVPADEYDKLYQSFNPTLFDAGQWVATAKTAGMKYLVITAKHHDGFCLWDSELTDYDIMATPFGRDVLAELAQECARQGIRFCVYYSICDWHHPDYPTDSPGGRGAKPSPNMDRYTRFMKGQVKELVEDYGPLGLVWFDGEWEKPWTVDRGDDLYRFVRSLRPDIIVNNRVNKARHGMAGTTRQDIANPGDYDTPEQQIGAFNRDRPWETCMTICGQWAWKPQDEMKSLTECVHALVRTAGGDGNFLFNVGPMPDGRIEPRQVDRLREMGAWLEKYGESIYGTRGGPIEPGPFGVSTCRGSRVYLHILDRPEGNVLLPPMPCAIKRVSVLTGGHATITEGPDGAVLSLPAVQRDPIDTIIALDLDRPAETIPPIKW
ncbi:MAG: alpha-L-fucosidase [Planctomycetota bacterium]